MKDAATKPDHTLADDLRFGEITIQLNSITGSTEIDDDVMWFIHGFVHRLDEAVDYTTLPDVDDDPTHDQWSYVFVLGDERIDEARLKAWGDDWNERHADEIAAHKAHQAEEAERLEKLEKFSIDIDDPFWDFDAPSNINER